MIIRSMDRGEKIALVEVPFEEIAALLGFTDWWDLDRTGKSPRAGYRIDVAEIARAAKLVRESKDKLKTLRAEYVARIGELDRLLAVGDIRPEPPQEEETP